MKNKSQKTTQKTDGAVRWRQIYNVLIGKDIALEGPRLKIEDIHSQVPIYITRAERVCLRLQIPRLRLRYFKTGVKNEHFRATNMGVSINGGTPKTPQNGHF